MDSLYQTIGMIVCGVGGGLLCLAIISILGYFACTAWADFSDKHRAICQAESLIFEYRKNRNEFLLWKHGERRESDETD
jgi:hypothetical protein